MLIPSQSKMGKMGMGFGGRFRLRIADCGMEKQKSLAEARRRKNCRVSRRGAESAEDCRSLAEAQRAQSRPRLSTCPPELQIEQAAGAGVSLVSE